ncbi:MAG: hypothetical protein LBH44_07615 [Treponema sp.]|jgi:hypothetical protein|nr:hypothetical protein [Treponema sp.]
MDNNFFEETLQEIDLKEQCEKRSYKVKPGSSSNAAAMVAALEAAHWPVGDMAPAGENPVDALTRFIMTDPVTLNRWRQLDPGGRRAPFEWDEVLAFGTNRFLRNFGIDHSPVTFYGAVSRKEIDAALDAGGAAVVSGIIPPFEAPKTPVEHAVAVTGREADSGYAVVDPWRDSGGSVRLTLADFNAFISPITLGKKRAHIIKTLDQ